MKKAGLYNILLRARKSRGRIHTNDMIKKPVFAAVFLCALLAVSCGGAGTGDNTLSTEDTAAGYTSISAEKAYELINGGGGYLILDVRTQSEYDGGHIAGAVLIPDYEISGRAPAEIPDRDKPLLVYCRSGRRSKNAAAELASLGYTNVFEFGGIIDWPYGTTAG